MRLSSPRSLLVLPLLLVAAACAKPRFAYEVDPAFRAASYGSVAPDPRKDRIVIREGMRPLNPDLHLKAVLTELELRRYRTVVPSAAELWVGVYILMGAGPEARNGRASSPHKEGSGESHHGGGRGGAGAGGAPPTGQGGNAHRNFILIIQLEDPKSGLPVWQGEANLSHQDRGPDGTPLSIEEAVHQLLQPLPARP